ncbi:hypothetical protein SprV_0802539500 [Sparganum proliferum]
MRSAVLSLISLLLLSRSSCLDTDPTASARVTRVTETSLYFEWTEPPSGVLQHILLKATTVTGTGTSVESRVSADLREGHVQNLEPYTYYSTSVTYVYEDSNKNLIIDTGHVRTWPAAPSPPTITSVVSTGASSIKVSWSPPQKTNGILEEYLAACYQLGDNYPGASRRVNAQTLTAEMSCLIPNHPYECAVIASTREYRWGQGGGKTSSARSSVVRTWPGTTEQPIYKHATARGPRSVYIEWWKPNTIYGILGHYSVTMAPKDDPASARDIKTNSDTPRLLVTQLQPNTKYTFTIRAFVLPNEQGLGGGYSMPSATGYVTTLADGPGAPDAGFDASVGKCEWESRAGCNDADSGTLTN